jgi:hypothetical protein
MNLALWEGREQALADVRAAMAMESDLTPADAAYGRSLLAEWPEDAEKHILEALSRDPYHYHARNMLLPILLVEGRLDECSNHAQIAALLFPDDPWPKMILAFVATFRGETAAVEKQLNALGNQPNRDDIATLKEILKLVSETVNLARTTDEPNVPPLFVGRVWMLANKFQKSSATGDLAALGANIVNLPAIGNVWGPQLRALQQTAIGLPTPAISADLERLVAHHHESVAYFLHGFSLIAETPGKNEAEIFALTRRAELSFRRATELPSLVPFMVPQARYWAAYAESLLAKSRGRPLDPEMKMLALDNMKRLLSDGRLSVGHSAILAELASNRLSEHDLARALLAEGERKSPGDLGLLRTRAQVELAAGAYHPALAAAEKVLAKAPKDAVALKVKQEAAEKLRPVETAKPPAAKP